MIGAAWEDSNGIGVNGEQGNNSAGDSGAVYVFVRRRGIWSQQAYLKASNTGAGDKFGSAVAIYGDTVVVGAPYEDSNATGVNGEQADDSANGSGAVYVFTRSGTTWSEQAYLKASNNEEWDNFGGVVAVSGDTLIVGALGEDSNATGINGNQADNSATYSGAAYVFTRTGTTWSQQAYLKASNTDAGDYFGWSVAVSGDTVVVGAPGENGNATGINGNQADNSAWGSGAAYVFTRSEASWSQQAYLKASNTDTGDAFGHNVSASGDTVLVGAPREASNATGVNGNQADNSAWGSGAAYVFTRSRTTWSQEAYLKPSNTDTGDDFGWSVAVSGNTVLVGAVAEDAMARGLMEPRGTTWPITPAQPTFSPAGAAPGASTTTSRPPTQTRVTVLATLWPSRATPWRSGLSPKAAAPPGSMETRRTTPLSAPAQPTSSAQTPGRIGGSPDRMMSTLEDRRGWLENQGELIRST